MIQQLCVDLIQLIHHYLFYNIHEFHMGIFNLPLNNTQQYQQSPAASS